MTIYAATITEYQLKAVNSGWYSIIPIASSLSLKNFDFINDLRLADEDFAIISPVNLNQKKLTIHNADFNIYGTVMAAFDNLQMDSKKVYINTENIVGGYVFVISCDGTNPDEIIGEVVIDDLTLDGKRSVLYKYGGIYMTGPQNFTIKNSYIGSYGFMFDAKQLTRADSPLACKPEDDVQQNIIMEYTTYNQSEEFTGTPHLGFIVSFLEWYPRHDMIVKFNHNTVMNIKRTFY